MESIAGENNVQNTTATESMHGWTDAWMDGWMDYVLLLYFSSTNLLPVSFLFFVSGGGKQA